MRFKIVSDSSANLHNIKSDIPFASVPMKLIAGAKEFVDDTALNIREMIDHLASYNGKSGSACPSISDWMDAFGDAENVLCFTIQVIFQVLITPLIRQRGLMKRLILVERCMFAIRYPLALK